jgi:hypothetical protein
LEKLKLYEVEDLKFGDSTRVCDSSRVSRATDMDMPFGYPQISIPGLAHYGSGQVQELRMLGHRIKNKFKEQFFSWLEGST